MMQQERTNEGELPGGWLRTAGLLGQRSSQLKTQKKLQGNERGRTGKGSIPEGRGSWLFGETTPGKNRVISRRERERLDTKSTLEP